MDNPLSEPAVTPAPVAPEPEAPEAPPGHSHKRQALEWFGLLSASLVIALLIRTFLFQPFYIPTESMYPTLKKDDRVIVNKLSYRLHDVHRGDIVVFLAPEGEATGGVKDLIKRVIALPGETVEAHDGRIYINGRALKEPYLPAGVVTDQFPAQKIPAGTYWMMGDNRAHSYDSRYWGPMKKSKLVGRAFARIWPLPRLGFL